MNRHTITLALALSTVVSLTAFSSTARAHPGESSFRLGLGIPLLMVDHYPAPDQTSVTYGLYPVTFGVHVGYQIISPLGIEVRLLGGGNYQRVGTVDTHEVIFAFAPRIEYMFTPHDTVGFYLGGEGGLQVRGLVGTNLSDLFHTGGFFGIHIFAVTEFSVDLEGAVHFLYDVDRDIAGVRGLLYFSITGWLA